MIAEEPPVERDTTTEAWRGFQFGAWQRESNVRVIIQQTYRPYNGNESFLAPATERTQSIWNRLRELFKQEHAKGVLEVSQVSSSITAHASGYIDRENEIVVGLQKEAPLRRAVRPPSAEALERACEIFRAAGLTRRRLSRPTSCRDCRVPYSQTWPAHLVPGPSDKRRHRCRR